MFFGTFFCLVFFTALIVAGFLLHPVVGWLAVAFMAFKVMKAFYAAWKDAEQKERASGDESGPAVQG